VKDSEYLLGIFWKAADKDAAFAKYLYQQTKERIESGRSMDCDEYRALIVLAQQPAHCEWKHECHAPMCDCGLESRTWADEKAELDGRSD